MPPRRVGKGAKLRFIAYPCSFDIVLCVWAWCYYIDVSTKYDLLITAHNVHERGDVSWS